MYATLFLLAFIIHGSSAFSCPSDSGVYVNPDDYRSYYVCSNRCYKLDYCISPKIYFTRANQTCIPDPPDWKTRFDLSGQFKSAEKTDIFIRQEGYKIYISHETSATHYALISRYINETHAIGIQTVRQLVNNCIVVFNARIVATGNRAYCYYETLHPYSPMCDLPKNYSGNYCKTY
jgi:hypothetical protein